MTTLVTGGAGFIGSHFVRAAHEDGMPVVVLDDLSAGPAPDLGKALLVQGDIADRPLLRSLISECNVSAVIHFAGKISVAESVRSPALYVEHNVARSTILLDELHRGGVRTFVFSSSAAVYGAPGDTPIDEASDTRPINPYGETKLAFERVLARYADLRWVALRYFNAAAAHPSGTMRERHEPETHLLPLAIDAALGRRPALKIFGTDYPTRDGTCIRDYVHVVDLADAHLLALRVLREGTQLGALNLGSGLGYSVREVLDAVEEVVGKPVPHVVAGRRSGDPPVLIADPSRARELLGWSCKRSDLKSIVADAVRSRI